MHYIFFLFIISLMFKFLFGVRFFYFYDFLSSHEKKKQRKTPFMKPPSTHTFEHVVRPFEI